MEWRGYIFKPLASAPLLKVDYLLSSPLQWRGRYYYSLRAVPDALVLPGSYEFVLDNDGLRDQSLTLIQLPAACNEWVHYVGFSRKLSNQIVVTAGLNQAVGEALVIIGVDLLRICSV